MEVVVGVAVTLVCHSLYEFITENILVVNFWCSVACRCVLCGVCAGGGACAVKREKKRRGDGMS